MTARRVVVDHVAFGVRDLAASRRFYEAALAPLGFARLYESEEGVAFGVEGADDFSIHAGDGRTGGAHVAFVAAGRAAVDAFHRAALAAGGRELHAPRLWPEYHAGYYAAFVLDPDGNSVEAVHHARAP